MFEFSDELMMYVIVPTLILVLGIYFSPQQRTIESSDKGLQFLSPYDIIELTGKEKKMGNYQTNLQTVMYVISVTLFVMSWDYIPPLARKVFSR